MDENKTYASFTIPQRDRKPADASAPPVRSAVADIISFTASGFAEIEIEEFPSRSTDEETAWRFQSGISLAEPIKERASDPVRQRFFDMRSLASGKPFARNDSELFYKQAKFMEDYTDDYEGEAKFFMYYPYYQHMGYEQLRTYFSWRTRFRQGAISPLQPSYIFLFIYELLSGIGVSSPADGLEKLVAVWELLAKNDPALDSYFPRWFRDYHIYYELPHSFEDFVREHGLRKLYSLMLVLDTKDKDSLELWNYISGYDITNSKFYNDGNEQLLQDCFKAVLRAIDDFCAARDFRIEDLLIYRVSNKIPWYPFKHALFFNWLDQPDRKVVLPGQERYYCQDNRWTASLPIFYSTQKDLIGYIIKKTESCLRLEVKYKNKISADSKGKYGVFRELKDIEANTAELDKVIEKAVKDFHRDMSRTVVTVDHMNLARIREEAQDTQEKLIVPEAAEKPRVLLNDKSEQYASPLSGIDEFQSSAVSQPADITQEDSAVLGCDKIDNYIDPPDYQDIETGDDDGWAALKGALNAVELKALSIILGGGEGLKEFADEKNIMLEVLADGINEKAADFIGDNILDTEDGMIIYDEYKDNVEKMEVL